MHEDPRHVTALELEHGLSHVLASPHDAGLLEAIIVRPEANQRRSVKQARLHPESGIEGDRWAIDSYYRLKGGGSDPRCQVSLMNARFLRQIAGSEEALCLAGDNLIVDLDLSAANLPAGSQLKIGKNVVLEISDLAHTGCSKFAARYGKWARSFTNGQRGKSLHLRGRYARIITAGTIHVGDGVQKLTSPA